MIRDNSKRSPSLDTQPRHSIVQIGLIQFLLYCGCNGSESTDVQGLGRTATATEQNKQIADSDVARAPISEVQAGAIASKYVQKIGGRKFAKTRAEVQKRGSVWKVWVSSDPPTQGHFWLVTVSSDGAILDTDFNNE